MKQDRLRTIGKLLRFLRECEDVPARELSKRMAQQTLTALYSWPPLDERCTLSMRELLDMPVIAP
jgi:hypothetical protein